MTSALFGFALSLALAVTLWVIGHGIAAALRLEAGDLGPGARLALGLSVSLLVLDGLGTFVPGRAAAWALLPLVLAGAAALLLRKAEPWREGSWADVAARHGPTSAVVAVALGIGAWPMFVAGRLAVAALTNDDATYYIDAADHLLAYPWGAMKPDPDGCLSNTMFHIWQWRTGVPWMMAAASAVTGLSPRVTLALVTPLLMALVPVGAWWLTQALGQTHGRRSLVTVGLAASVSTAVVFVALQDMTSHLGALALFPCAVAALARAVERGTVRAVLVAALMLGLSVTLFADGSSVLLAGSLAVGLAALGKWRQALRRGLASWGVAAALFPVTFYRAALALYGTLAYRAQEATGIFPTRGWLPHSLGDDLATLAGVDPWPPWPGPRPLDALAFAQLAGLAGAAMLLALAARRLRRSALAWSLLAVFGGTLAWLELRHAPPYLLSKVLLTFSAFLVPVLALGAAGRSRLAWPAAALYVTGVFASLSFLAAPARFFIVDGPEHDRLEAELRALPAGSLLVLDGFGAPTDVMHDTHRVFRAALRAGLRPLFSGLDGGFYGHCPAAWVTEPPARAFSIQRTTSENVSTGVVRAAWGPFSVREVDLGLPESRLGAWSALTGWREAEREPDGSVFRWAGAEATVQVRSLSRLPCLSIRGEVRTREGAARLSLRKGDDVLADVVVSADWSPFETQAMPSSLGELLLSFHATPLDGASDPDRVFALRRAQLVPRDSCGSFLRAGRPTPGSATPEPLADSRSYEVLAGPGVTCGRVVARVAHGPGRVGVRLGGQGVVTWTSAPTGGTMLAPSAAADLAQASRLEVLRDGPPDAAPWTVEALKLEPAPCPLDLPRSEVMGR